MKVGAAAVLAFTLAACGDGSPSPVATSAAPVAPLVWERCDGGCLAGGCLFAGTYIAYETCPGGPVTLFVGACPANVVDRTSAAHLRALRAFSAAMRHDGSGQCLALADAADRLVVAAQVR